MAGSVFGRLFRIMTWGESHGKAVGVVIDGCPAGLSLCEADIQALLDKRRPGQGPLSTPRKEADRVEILSGVFEGKTTGTPLSLLVRNEDQRSRDYSQIAEIYRPGHADYPFDAKYGFRDYRGGGRSSGRETIGRVAAGAVAGKLLGECGIQVESRVIRVGGIDIPWDAAEPFALPAGLSVEAGNSLGGVVECRAEGLPAGLGETVFDKLDARLSQAVMSIGAVKGVEIGDGFAAADLLGSENNDPFCLDEEGRIAKKTNHAGGTLGGMSDGSPLILRAAIKPTPSISLPQKTVNRSGEETEIQISGRHDICIAPRAAVVVTSMVSLVLADALLENLGARMEYVRTIYQR